MECLMEKISTNIYEVFKRNENTNGIVVYESKQTFNASTDHFHMIMLVIIHSSKPIYQIKHYQYLQRKIAVYMMDERTLHHLLITGESKRLVRWLLNGVIVFERDSFMTKTIKLLKAFPVDERQKKMGVEFAKFLFHFTKAKELFDYKHHFDSYNHVVHALHHLAHLAVAEYGVHPELTVWKQVKEIDLETYKLYEEFITSNESLEKKLELLFLACDFSVVTKLKMGSLHLVNIMQKRNRLWSIQDLVRQEELKMYSLYLVTLLEFLVEKDIVKVVGVETTILNLSERLYFVEKNS